MKKLTGEFSVKRIFEIGRGRVISQLELAEDGKYPVYSSQTKNNGCLGYINTYDFDCEQITWTTDGANAGTIFLRTGKHNCTNVCGTLKLKENYVEQYNLHYLKYVLGYFAELNKREDTNGYKIMNNEMANIKILTPSINEQNKLAAFLDDKCAKLDFEIENNRKSIDLLEEYRKTIITQRVIQDDIKLTKLKYKTEINPKTLVNIKKDEIVTYTPMEFIKRGYYIPNEGILSNYNSSYNMYRENDVVLAKVTPCFENGNVSIMSNLKNGYGYGSSELYVLRCNDSMMPKFLLYLLQNSDFINLGKASMTGTGGLKRVSSEFIKNYCISDLTLEEQEKIVEYLDNKCNLIDKAIAYRKRLIEKLEEYKKSLIYEAVTGKLEV